MCGQRGREREREGEGESLVYVFLLLHNACVLHMSYANRLLGGSEEAREVTVTTTKAGKFDA